MVVTDNSTGFVSSEFEEFLRADGVKHTTSAPYHPASNGLAERAIQIVKKGLKKLGDWVHVTSTGQSPVQLQNDSSDDYWHVTG